MTKTPDRPDAAEMTMKDVSHTPPWGECVTNVWHRGRTDGVSSDSMPDATGAASD